MKITEQNFIKKFKRGKEDALEYVIDEYIGIVKAVIYNTFKVHKDRQLIEECISDTFLGAFENARQFKGDQEDFRKWLCTIAKFKAIDKQRKISRDPSVTEIFEKYNPVESAEEEFFARQSIDEVLKMMNELQTMDKDIFMMKYFLNMSNKDIAIHLGLTKASVDNRIYRGKKKLQQLRLGGMFS